MILSRNDYYPKTICCRAMFLALQDKVFTWSWQGHAVILERSYNRVSSDRIKCCPFCAEPIEVEEES